MTEHAMPADRPPLPWGGAAWVGAQAGLFLGVAGQGGLLSPWLSDRGVPPPAALLLLAPLLALFAGTFTNVRLLSSRALGWTALLAALAFAGTAGAVEALLWNGALPVESPAYARGVLRGLMHAGWLAVPPLLYVWRKRC